MVAYDDWGGWYDHVKPPQVDRWGYGFRVPAFLVSPYAKAGVIDSTELDFTSPLAFIEENWGLPPLARRDARANTFLSAFDFSQPPRSQTIVPYSREAPESDQGPPRSLFFWAYGAGMLLAAGAIAAAAMSAHRGPLAPVRPISEAGGGP
jgi:phospholipase C